MYRSPREYLIIIMIYESYDYNHVTVNYDGLPQCDIISIKSKFMFSRGLILPCAVRLPTESAGIDRSESMLKSKDLFEDLE